MRNASLASSKDLKSPAAVVVRDAFQHHMPYCVTLNEQMRAAEDEPLRALLSRVRTRSCTEDDVALVNSRRVDALSDARVLAAIDAGAVVICERNSLREAIGEAAARRFAALRGGPLQIYAAHDYRVADAAHKDDGASNAADVAAVAAAAAAGGRRRKRVASRPLTAAMQKYVASVPANNTGKLPREVFFFPGMPVVVIDNVAGGKSGVQLGIANGMTGIVVGGVDNGDDGITVGQGVRAATRTASHPRPCWCASTRRSIVRATRIVSSSRVSRQALWRSSPKIAVRFRCRLPTQLGARQTSTSAS